MKNTIPPNHNYYNKQLQPFASDLRKRMTKAEACLWKYVLRARMMKGYTFNRQRPVLNFIADFMCKELKLVIEVDGYTYLDEKVQQKDKRKDQALQEAGFTVLRFTDDQVLQQIESVCSAIESRVEAIDKNKPFQD